MKTKPLTHYVQSYFLSYLIAQRGYGRNTVASYRDTFKLLFIFLEENKRSVVGRNKNTAWSMTIFSGK